MTLFWKPRQSRRRPAPTVKVEVDDAAKVDKQSGNKAKQKSGKKQCAQVTCSIGACENRKVQLKNALIHFSIHQSNGDNDKDTCALCGQDGHMPTLNSSGKKWIFPEACRFAGNTLNVKKLKVISGTSPLANFPVKCGNCNKMVWRFNMEDHHTRLHSDKPCPDTAKVPSAEKSLLLKKSKNTKNTLSAACLKKLTDPEILLLPLSDFWDAAKKKWKANVFGTFGKQHSARLKRLFGENKFE